MDLHRTKGYGSSEHIAALKKVWTDTDPSS